jgi:uncharacterized protein YndB with AHSA1/START domain
MRQSIERSVLRLERTVPAPLAAVYRALTDPEELARWWGPRGFVAPDIDFDPRVGGGYRIAMQPPDDDLFHLSGAFREVEPPSRLAYTFRWEPPHPDDRETLVTISLQDRGESTDLLLTQGEFATGERHALHEAGWTESLDRLEQLLGNNHQIRGDRGAVEGLLRVRLRRLVSRPSGESEGLGEETDVSVNPRSVSS